MNYDPHALHQILEKIREQMRCPQCSRPVDIGFPSVKIAGDDFLLLQLKCDQCQAFILLHVSLSGTMHEELLSQDLGLSNASSTLKIEEGELDALRKALEESDGSFEKLFSDDKKRSNGRKNGPTMIA
jgi:hypothetical protein